MFLRIVNPELRCSNMFELIGIWISHMIWLLKGVFRKSANSYTDFSPVFASGDIADMTNKLIKFVGICIGTILVFAATIFLIDKAIPYTPLSRNQIQGHIYTVNAPVQQQSIQGTVTVAYNEDTAESVSVGIDEG